MRSRSQCCFKSLLCLSLLIPQQSDLEAVKESNWSTLAGFMAWSYGSRREWNRRCGGVDSTVDLRGGVLTAAVNHGGKGLVGDNERYALSLFAARGDGSKVMVLA